MTSENPPIEVYRTIGKSSSLENVPHTMTSENPPIEERCGLESIDTIAVGLLVRAPLDQVASIVAQSALRWERDVYGQTIRGCGLLVFQFRGHAWTGILDGKKTDQYRDILNGYVSSYWDWKLQAQSLSQRLHTQTIYYWVDDSGCTIGYTYWDNGTVMERLEFDEAIWQDNRYGALLEDEDEDLLEDDPEHPFEPHLFESQLRQTTAAEIESAYAFVDDFLCEQQAYAATRFNAFSFQRDDFERVDYIAFA